MPPDRRESYTTGTGQEMTVHHHDDCIGDACVIHRPSQHSMSHFPTHWRRDRGLMERICPHRVGHPDPDDLAAKRLMSQPGEYELFAWEVHGCDGCCQ